MKHDVFLRKYPVFTGDDLDRHLASHSEVGERTRESILSYYQKSGRIVRVRNNLYAVVPPEADPDTYPIDPFLIASRLTDDAVISHQAALQFYGKSYFLRRCITYSAGRPLLRFTFRAQEYRGIKFPKALRITGQEKFSAHPEERFGVELLVTCLERTLVDVLHRPDVSGSWEEIWRSLESIEFFDLDKVVEYVQILNNATTAAKVGFFLEQHRETFMVEERYLKTLRNKRPVQPHYMERSNRNSGRLVSGWNLVVPTQVYERVWGEVV